MSTPRRASPDVLRRGWCPGLARPMPTGDGLLARLHPPLGCLSLLQLRAVAQAARDFGNGHVDVTARGNLQIRGVSESTTRPLADALTAIGLGDGRADGGPQRLTLTSPLAGLDPNEPCDVLDLARRIEAAGLAIAGLPAKTLVAIEGPGIAGGEGDLFVRPRAGSVRIVLAGEPGASRAVPVAQAAEAVAALLHSFVSSGKRRVRDLSGPEREQLLEAAGRIAGPAPPLRGGAEAIQRRDHSGQGGGSLDGVAPLAMTALERAGADSLVPGLTPIGGIAPLIVEAPFGRCTAAALDALADAAERAGALEVRSTPSRGFVLAGSNARAARDSLAEAGFITDSGDPRRAVAACPGAPACRSGSTPVPAHAAQLARAFAPFAARGLTAHVSGCAKGCAHPGPADLTLVAEAGAYRVTLGGAPSEALGSRLTFETALERVRRADPARLLSDAFHDLAATAP